MTTTSRATFGLSSAGCGTVERSAALRAQALADRGPTRRARRRARRKLGKRRGTEFIEFTILFPFYLLFMMFILDMGRVAMMRAGLQDATQAVARYGAQNGGLGPNCPNNGGACTGGVLVGFQGDVGQLPGGSSGQIKSLTAVSGAGNGCSVNNPYVTVTSTYQFHFITPGLYQIVSLMTQATNGWLLTTSATARCEIAK